MVLCAQDTDINLAETGGLRPSIERIQTLVILPTQATVQVNKAFFELDIFEHGDCDSMLLGSHDNIIIAVRTQARRRVKSRHCPAFDQDWFHPGRRVSETHGYEDLRSEDCLGWLKDTEVVKR
jgi:hypothetical protein